MVIRLNGADWTGPHWSLGTGTLDEPGECHPSLPVSEPGHCCSVTPEHPGALLELRKLVPFFCQNLSCLIDGKYHLNVIIYRCRKYAYLSILSPIHVAARKRDGKWDTPRGCVLNLSVIYSSHPQGVRPSSYSKYSQTNTGFEAHTDVDICQLRRNVRPIYQMCLVFNTNTYMHNLAQSKLSRTFYIALKCTL